MKNIFSNLKDKLQNRNQKLNDPKRRQQFFILGAILLFAVIGVLLQLSSRAAVQIESVKSGNWNDPAVWSSGSAPRPNDYVIVSPGHTVTHAGPTSVTGVKVRNGATLRFDPNSSATLETNAANIIIEGKLEMKPASPTINHYISFINIDETKVVGGGMSPLDTDVGLWVMGAGRLDILGSKKTSWTRAAANIAAGSRTITLERVPEGWRAGDEIVITPTIKPTPDNGKFHQDVDHAKAYDESTITSINGNQVTLAHAMKFPHPQVSFTDWKGDRVTYGAEVLNLTRNVRIAGTGGRDRQLVSPEGNSRAHIFIHSSNPQSVKYAEIRHMGPRTYVPGSGTSKTMSLLGRYSLHFHHSRDGSRGSIIEGVAVHRGGSHSYVPHDSHGVTFRNNVSHETIDSAYWWDVALRGEPERPATHDTLYDSNVASKVFATNSTAEGYRMGGFDLNAGDDMTNTAINNVAVGVHVERQTFNSSAVTGFHWPERANDATGRVWNFTNNIAHNNGGSGLFVWQNSNNTTHLVEKFTAYHNGSYGIDHGAYQNYYQYTDAILYGNRTAGLAAHAVTRRVNATPKDAPRLRFTNIHIDGAGLTQYGTTAPSHRFAAAEGEPTEMINFNIRGVTKAAFYEGDLDNASLLDIRNATIAPGIKQFEFHNNAAPANLYIVRNLNNSVGAFELRPKGQPGTPVAEWNASRTNISAQADTIPPEVIITSPKPGGGVEKVFTIAATAKDNVGVTKVEFYVNGVLRNTDTSAPYSYQFDSSSIKGSGVLPMSARAYDAAGNDSFYNISVIMGKEPTPVKQGDLNGDNVVNIFDLSILLTHWGTNHAAADLNKDGIVNLFDLSILLSNWG